LIQNPYKESSNCWKMNIEIGKLDLINKILE
jgi:hypothetical protein